MYIKQVWTDNVSPLAAARFNSLENGLAIAAQLVGTGTTLPATGIQAGDLYVLTTGGQNTLWRYTGSRWVLAEDPVFATVAARDTWTTALPASAAYEGMRVWITPQGQHHVYTLATTYSNHWRGTASTLLAPATVFPTGNQPDGTVGSLTNTNYSDGAWHCFAAVTAFPDPGYPYRVEADLRLEVQQSAINRVTLRVHLGTSNIDAVLGYLTTALATTWFQAQLHSYSAPVTGAQNSIHWDFQAPAGVNTQVTSFQNSWIARVIPWTEADKNL